jgi:RNA polymerase sigma factor (TIGR02999 family)
MAQEAPGQTLQPTALVHEAWLRLGADAQPLWQNRAHFFAAASEAMRRILVDSARRKLSARRGARAEHVNAEDTTIVAPVDDDQILAVDEALERFAAHQPQKAQLVQLRYFGGLNHEESARALNISEPTAKRWWAYARAWLLRDIQNARNR